MVIQAYGLFQPLAKQLTSASQSSTDVSARTALRLYFNSLKFYGLDFHADQIIYMLLFINATNVTSMAEMLLAEKKSNAALKFCRSALEHAVRFSNAFEHKPFVAGSRKASLSDVEELAADICIEDSKTYSQLVLAPFVQLSCIRSHFLSGKAIERKLNSYM